MLEWMSLTIKLVPSSVLVCYKNKPLCLWTLIRNPERFLQKPRNPKSFLQKPKPVLVGYQFWSTIEGSSFQVLFVQHCVRLQVFVFILPIIFVECLHCNHCYIFINYLNPSIAMEESRHKDKKSAPDTWYCLWLWWFSMDNGGSSWKWLMWKKYQLCNQYWMVKHKIWCVRPWRDQVEFIHIAHKKIEMWTNTWQWTEWLVFHWCSC